ncbi:MAG: S24 family peptidase [Pseudomonadota bacterium]
MLDLIQASRGDITTSDAPVFVVPPELQNLPELFALQVTGYEMEPEINDGETIIVERDAPCGVGNLVVVLPLDEDAVVMPWVMRLESKIDGLTFPALREHEGGGNVQPLVSFKQNHSDRVVTLRGRQIFAIYRVALHGEQARQVLEAGK